MKYMYSFCDQGFKADTAKYIDKESQNLHK